MGLSCPKCRSDQVQSIEVIVTSGTSVNNGTFVGVGTDGPAFATSSGVSQTSLASRFSKPRGPSWFLTVWLSLGLVICAYLLLSVNKFAPILPLAVMAFFIRQDVIKSKEYKAQLLVWERLYNHGFFCHKCGNTFLA